MKIITTPSFEKDYKRIKKRGYDTNLLKDVVKILAEGKPLPQKYKEHSLKGNYKGYMECHILPDWLLIKRYINNISCKNRDSFRFILKYKNK